MNAPRKLRTLLVDDEALSRRGLELRLRMAGDIEIVGQCTNGREALAAIRELRPDLVFLDIQMPGLSGFDVLAELQPHELPMIVFVTAYDRFAVQAFEARAIDYVLKPVDDARLAATLTHVRELVEQRTAVAERNQLVNLLAELRGSGEIESTASQRRAAGAELAADPQRPRNRARAGAGHRMGGRRGRLSVHPRRRAHPHPARHHARDGEPARSAAVPARAPLHHREPDAREDRCART